MRKFHRWLSVLFGVILLWVAGTGVAMQAVDLFGGEDPAPAAAAKVAAGAVAPPAQAHGDDRDNDAPPVKPGAATTAAPGATGATGATAAAGPAAAGMAAPGSPRPRKPLDWHHTLQHLHSGETFGPIGTLLNSLGGIALLFFAFSGLWMYIRMWSHRRSKAHKPAWFWK